MNRKISIILVTIVLVFALPVATSIDINPNRIHRFETFNPLNGGWLEE